MTSSQVAEGNAATASGTTAVPFRLEVVVIPVADVDRAKAFYTGLGWRVDAEADLGDGYRLMQLTPVTAAQPGSFDGLLLVVDNIDEARNALLAQGVEVSEAFHDARGGPIGGFQIGDQGRAPGHDPQGRSYATYASFHDTEGNRWLLQEITQRLPGRV